jgi:phosphatidylinositol glycan class Z
LYIALVLARFFVGPFLPGYIHPDEFFQGGQELWFGCPPTIPWEFEPQNALRSVVPPTLLSWLPLYIYSLLLGRPMGSLSGNEVLIIPRVACAILSVLTVDGSIWSLCNTTKGVPIPVLLLASAWPTMAMLNRPFSNALETYFLALLLASILKGKRSVWTCAVIGALCALGLFTRFTFVFFAFPAMLYFLYSLLETMHGWRGAIPKILVTGLSFVVISAAIIHVDTSFYSSRSGKEDDPSSSIILTPWNALSYNSQVSNLKEHGLHPRWTHAAVNMFLLYGPMTVVAYLQLLTNNPSEMGASQTVYRLVLLFGLFLLSLAPHQEPRFLLPLMVPLVLLCSNSTLSGSRAFCGVWVIFNMILLLVFGGLHQAGVSPSLLALGTTPLLERQMSTLIYFHTYMPPTFLSRQRGQETCDTRNDELACKSDTEYGSACQEIRIVDLNGSNMETLIHTLGSQLSCSTAENPVGDNTSIHLAVPQMTEDVNGNRWSFAKQCDIPFYDCQLLWSYTPHLSTEDLPPYDGTLQGLYREMSLNLYEISCKHAA